MSDQHPAPPPRRDGDNFMTVQPAPTGVATVPLTLSPSRQMMALSAASRQAAIDAATAPPGLTFGAVWDEREGIGAFIRVQGKNAHGEVQWEAPYNTKGQRLTIVGGVTF